MIRKAENLTYEQLSRLRSSVGEAFVTNELFHNWGSLDERRADVMTYMSLYFDYVYEAGELYVNDDLTGCIGLEDSSHPNKWPQVKMLFRMFARIRFSRIRSLLKFVKQISGSNALYAKAPHIDALMVCVDKEHQGKGIARELVLFAKQMARDKHVPLLFDTDMKEYAQMYEHFGCEVYNTVKADNGVTRYSLVWREHELQSN